MSDDVAGLETRLRRLEDRMRVVEDELVALLDAVGQGVDFARRSAPAMVQPFLDTALKRLQEGAERLRRFV